MVGPGACAHGYRSVFHTSGLLACLPGCPIQFTATTALRYDDVDDDDDAPQLVYLEKSIIFNIIIPLLMMMLSLPWLDTTTR